MNLRFSNHVKIQLRSNFMKIPLQSILLMYSKRGFVQISNVRILLGFCVSLCKNHIAFRITHIILILMRLSSFFFFFASSNIIEFVAFWKLSKRLPLINVWIVQAEKPCAHIWIALIYHFRKAFCVKWDGV